MTAPLLLYTDCLSGPITGGENGNGCYLSIFGVNLGNSANLGTSVRVYIGGVEVASYRTLGNSAVATRTGIQQLVVQVGGLGSPTLGVALAIKVTVDGIDSNTNLTFTPNPGSILFVSLTGDDTTAIAGDITKPFRHLQTSGFGGAYGSLHAGDHIVVRGGNWSDTGFDGAWMRFSNNSQQEGSLPTGASHTGWMHLTAYPGEDVHYTTGSSTKGGIHGVNSAYLYVSGDYFSVSNLRIDVDAAANSDAGPINLQYTGGPWRVVNNKLGPWPANVPAPNNARAAGISGHGQGTKALGNYIHDIACGAGALENHGMYIDPAGKDWEIAYNWIENITGGNLIQFFDNVGLAGNNYGGFPTNWTGFTGMDVHHNYLDTSGKYGLNISQAFQSGRFYNNVVRGANYAGLRIDVISQSMSAVFALNTFYNNDRLSSGSGNAQILNTWGAYSPTGTMSVLNNIFAAGPNTIAGSTYYANVGTADNYLTIKQNLYYDGGNNWGTFSRDTLAMFGDPYFINAAAANFALSANSTAIDAATQTLGFSVDTDFVYTTRPQGVRNDIGAFEFATSGGGGGSSGGTPSGTTFTYSQHVRHSLR